MMMESPVAPDISTLEESQSSTDLVPAHPANGNLSAHEVVLPAILTDAGEDAVTRFAEIFTVNIRNPHTRRAYFRNAITFLRWCEARGIRNLKAIKPIRVAAYIEQLQQDYAKPSVKQQLATIRMLFDWLVTGQVIDVNPAHAVRGPKHVVKTGKTPVFTADETRVLLDSIPTSRVIGLDAEGNGIRVPDLTGLRDRAIIAAMVYTFARVGAMIAMTVEDYYSQGKRSWLRLHEKGGKQHEMPAHHTLEEYLDEYLKAAGIEGDRKGPLFRTAPGKGAGLTRNPLRNADVWRMIRRRLKAPASRPWPAATASGRRGSPATFKTRERWKKRKRWLPIPARAPPSSTTAPATRSPSTRSRRS